MRLALSSQPPRLAALSAGIAIAPGGGDEGAGKAALPPGSAPGRFRRADRQPVLVRWSTARPAARGASSRRRPGGIVLPAHPELGRAYRQEYDAGEAEDAAEILRSTLMTKDFTPLQPRVLEHKLSAEGVGPVSVLGLSGGSGREELLRFERHR